MRFGSCGWQELEFFHKVCTTVGEPRQGCGILHRQRFRCMLLAPFMIQYSAIAIRNWGPCSDRTKLSLHKGRSLLLSRSWSRFSSCEQRQPQCASTLSQCHNASPNLMEWKRRLDGITMHSSDLGHDFECVSRSSLGRSSNGDRSHQLW